MNNDKRLSKSRSSIEDVTVQIIKLIHKRLELGKEIAELKYEIGLPLHDPKQEKKLYKTVLKKTKNLDFDPSYRKQIIKLLVNKTLSEEQYFIRQTKHKSSSKKLKVSIIGGTGNMGQWLTKYFSSYGYDVGIYSRTLNKKTKFSSFSASMAGLSAEYISGSGPHFSVPIFNSIKECIANSDIIIVSVPISRTNKILDEIALCSGKNHTIVEISSIKSDIVKNMKKLSKKHQSTFVSIHPLFGPGASIYNKQKYALIPIKSEFKEKQSFRKIFPNSKLSICDVTSHDKSMAYVISLIYYTNLVLLSTIPNSSQISELSGNTFTLQNILSLAMLNDKPEIISSLQIDNKYFLKILKNYFHESQKINLLISKHDSKKLNSLINKLKKNSSDFDIIRSYDSLYSFIDELNSYK